MVAAGRRAAGGAAGARRGARVATARAGGASAGPAVGSPDTVARRTARERAAVSSAAGRGRAGAGGNRAEALTGALLGGCCENASSPRKRARRRTPTAAGTVPAAGASTKGLDAAWNGAETALGSGTSSAMRRNTGTTRLPISSVQERASGIERETAKNFGRAKVPLPATRFDTPALNPSKVRRLLYPKEDPANGSSREEIDAKFRRFARPRS